MAEPDSVVLQTSMGDIQLELYWRHAPKVHFIFSPHFTSPDGHRRAGISRNWPSVVTTMVLYSIVLYRYVEYGSWRTPRYLCGASRTSWHRLATQRERAEEEQVFTAKNCEHFCIPIDLLFSVDFM